MKKEGERKGIFHVGRTNEEGEAVFCLLLLLMLHNGSSFADVIHDATTGSSSRWDSLVKERKSFLPLSPRGLVYDFGCRHDVPSGIDSK